MVPPDDGGPKRLARPSVPLRPTAKIANARPVYLQQYAQSLTPVHSVPEIPAVVHFIADADPEQIVAGLFGSERPMHTVASGLTRTPPTPHSSNRCVQ